MTLARRLLPAHFRFAHPMARDKSDTLLLLGSCVLVLLPHLGHLPAWVIPAGVALLAWRAWITFSGNRMPPRWLLLPIALFALAGVYASYRTVFGRDAGVAMLTLLLTLKMLEMHAKRDLFVVLFLSHFLILASFFYSQSILTAIGTIAAVLAILTTQVSFQYTGAVPPLRQRVRLGATILALAAPLTLVLFLLFPRIQGPLWGLPSDAHAGRTGLSDTMSTGNISKLALSDEVAFRVKFAGNTPPRSQLYWRGVVLGQYDGRTWTQPGMRWFPGEQIQLKLLGAAVHYEVTLEPHGRHWLFALEVPGSLPHIPGNAASIDRELQLRSLQAVNERVRYDVASHVDFEVQADAPRQSMRQWLQLPPGFNPRTREFTRRLREQHTSQTELINAVLRHFRRDGFRYTLEPPLLGTHVIDEFLFDTRAGFCEHYSGAFVFLMRALGIPARVVTGYQGGELNPADGFLAVRQSDAHAWAEVWLENRGWLRIDPTAAVAPDRIEQSLTNLIPRQAFGGLITLDPRTSRFAAQWLRLRQNWDALSNGWNQWVLNYTPERQQDFLRGLGFKQVDWRVMIGVMLVLGILAVAMVVLPLILHQQKRDPVEAIYRRLCKRLERQGMPKAAHEGPRAYATRLTAAESPLPQEKKAALARFLEIYESMRYGAAASKAIPASEISKLKSLLVECR